MPNSELSSLDVRLRKAVAVTIFLTGIGILLNAAVAAMSEKRYGISMVLFVPVAAAALHLVVLDPVMRLMRHRGQHLSLSEWLRVHVLALTASNSIAMVIAVVFWRDPSRTPPESLAGFLRTMGVITIVAAVWLLRDFKRSTQSHRSPRPPAPRT